MGIQLPLGFSSGVPLLLTGSTLVAWLSDANVSVETIGLFALVGVPYTFKFVWAPLLDRFSVPLLGRRRGWMLLTQLLLLLSIAWMGLQDPGSGASAIAIAALGVAFLSATQDIVVDAYRTDALHGDERGRGSATYVIGYRIAMIVAGAGALMLADHMSWRIVYFIMAGLMFVGMVATWLAPAPAEVPPPQNLYKAVVEPLKEFFWRRGAVFALAFVMLYKFGDALASNLTMKFLLDLEFSKTDVGLIQKFLGLGATILGCSIGGYWADRIGLWRALLIFGAAQAVANAGYLLLALTGKSYPLLVVGIGVDNICNGLGTAAFVAYVMSLCHRSFSATQYALLTSAAALLGRTLGASAGYVQQSTGWAGFFGITIAVAAPALLMLLVMKRDIDAREADNAADD